MLQVRWLLGFSCILALLGCWQVDAQHPCSAPNSWVGNYMLFTNWQNEAPVTEGLSTYNALFGVRYDGVFGQSQLVFYNLPSAFYLVNTTAGSATSCRKIDCRTNCFKPITVGGEGWRFNSTVVVGLAKVEKWSVFDPRGGRETVIIDQPLANSGFKQCFPIMNNNVRGTEENNVQFMFGLWYNVKIQDTGAAEFVPPSICPPATLASLDSRHAALVDHFMGLNSIYRPQL